MEVYGGGRRVPMQTIELCEIDRYRIDNFLHAVATLEGLVDRMSETQTRMDADTAAYRALIVREEGAIGLFANIVNNLKAELAAALAQASANGVTDEQLTAFEGLNAKLSTDVDTMATLVATPAPVPGPDTTEAPAGDDTISGADGTDTVAAPSGDGGDTVAAGGGADSVAGAAGDDSPTAGTGDDQVAPPVSEGTPPVADPNSN